MRGETGDDGSAVTGDDGGGGKESLRIKYTLVRPGQFDPPESHNQVDDHVYIAPDGRSPAFNPDVLEEAFVIDIHDYDHGSDEIAFNGPPEPLVDETGEEVVEVAYPEEDTTRPGNPTKIPTVLLGTWVCKQCGVETVIPPEDGEIPDPHCSNCDRGGPFNHRGVGNDDIQTAVRAGEMWHPPSDVSNEGFDKLWDDVRDYLYAHWDAEETAIYEGLTAYALSTWLRPNLTFVPHLMLMGKTTGGKTRLLNTLAHVSYRAVVSASATPASMYRMIDAHDVTFFVSEYHGLDPDSQRELDNVVRAGQKRGEIVTRAEQTAHGYEPDVYDPFSHIAVATQYTPEDDIVNRCIQVRSESANRDMPATLADATHIRNRLLYARYRLLDSDEWKRAEDEAYRVLESREIDGRTREKLLSLVTVAIVWDRLDAFEPYIERVVEQDREAAKASEDALAVEAIRDLAFEEIGDMGASGQSDPFASIAIPYSVSEDISGEGIAERYESLTGVEKSASWVGHVISRLGLETKRTRDGTVINDPDLQEKLQELCENMNLGWERLEPHRDVVELSEANQSYGDCEECGKEAWRTHEHVEEGHYLCNSCAEQMA